MSNQSWTELKKYYDRMHASKIWEKNFAVNTDLQLTDDEVLMSSYPKCGTNWMNQILHQIRVGGNEDFDFLYSVMLLAMGKQLNIDMLEKSGNNDTMKKFADNFTAYESKYSPKVFYAHLYPHDALPLGGKQLVVLRNPVDALVSFFRFFPNLVNIDEEKIGIEDFYFKYYVSLLMPNYFTFVRDWIVAIEKQSKPILLVFNEDLKEDLSAMIDRISEFTKMPLDGEAKERVLQLCSFANMSAKPEKYNPPDLFYQMRANFVSVPADEPQLPMVGVVRSGKGGYQVPDCVREHMQMMWEAVIMPTTGYKSYEELRKKYSLVK